MEQSLGFAHFLSNADSISRVLLGLMLFMSIGTWYVIVVKSIRSFNIARGSKGFVESFWKTRSLRELSDLTYRSPAQEPFHNLVDSGFVALSMHEKVKKDGGTESSDEYITRALKRSMDDDRVRMEFGLTFVATVASSAPFIGLFGTVWGIYHALLAIGISGQGTLDKVAGPVGEALIMTAIGLVVAIPAAISYNFFSRVNRNVLARLDSFAYDVLTFLGTGHRREGKKLSESVSSVPSPGGA